MRRYTQTFYTHKSIYTSLKSELLIYGIQVARTVYIKGS